MVATRSSPRKKQIEPVEPEIEQELDEDDEDAPEKTSIKVDDAEVKGIQLAPQDNNPPKLFILPQDTSPVARIVTLPKPVNGAPSRYFACPEKGIYEFTRVAAHKSIPRSVLLAPNSYSEDANAQSEEESPDNGSIAKGYIAESAEIFVATPIDPLFMVVPILAPASAKSKKRLFVPLDDHLDTASPSLRHLLRQDAYRRSFENRLDAICDKVEAGDESMYRLSDEKLAAVLVSKARRMVWNGLPASLEEKFVRQALQAPIMSIKREDTVTSQTQTSSTTTTPLDRESQVTIAVEDSQTPSEVSTQKDSTFSQLSTTTSMTSISISQDPTTDDILPDAPPQTNEASEEIKHLLRLRTSLTYLTTCYIPTHLSPSLHPLFNKTIDFSPLDAHLKHLSSLHEEARALRALSDNIARKRGLDDDEAAEERAEKKRKREEEEKRKKGESNALKALKKVDTKGMKKMSSFFTKIPKKS